MTEDIKDLLHLYSSSPTLVLFENMTGSQNSMEKDTISKIVHEHREHLNPLDVVLESLINVVSEDISRNELTHSSDTVLINHEIQSLAAKRIIDFINNDKTKLELLHQSWLRMLLDFLRQLSNERKNPRIDEVVFDVGSKFRISSPSAVKAIASVDHLHS